MPSVYIQETNREYNHMFLNRGWSLCPTVYEADLVQFTGGSDVTPSLYGEEPHPYAHNDHVRDEIERNLYSLCIRLMKPMAGICRGGQFLNVMGGGSMWQHVNNHAIGGTHLVTNLDSNKLIPVTSTHHQMMIPGKCGQVLGKASESTLLESMEGGRRNMVEQTLGEDIEVVWYPGDQSLCFQPHPEYLDKDSLCQRWYFDLIERYLNVS